jgi:hypothetical protein
MKAGSLFPSYEKSLLESNIKKQQDQENDVNNGKTKKHKVKKFDVEAALLQQLHQDPKASNSGSPFMLVDLDDEIRRMNNDEYISKHKVDRVGGAVIKDETDLEMGACLDRISRMKTVCNKLTVIQNEKLRLINNLHRQVVHRHETDQQLIDEVVNSEVLLRHLNTRNVAMEQDMEVARQVEDGYNELLKVLKNNPPYIESHVKALEIEAQLAQKQFEDMCEHRNKLYHETELANENKRQQLIERIEYFQHARYEVAVKKKQVLRQTRTLGGPNKRGGKMHRRTPKSAAQRALLRSGNDSNENSESSGSDSDNSMSEKKEIQLTAPVMHFLNAMVRKTTFNETIVKESDQTLDDIKKRFDEEERMNIAPSAKHRKLNRMGSVDVYNNEQYLAAAAAAAAQTAATAPVPANSAAELDADGHSVHSSASVKNSGFNTGRGSQGSLDSGGAGPHHPFALQQVTHAIYPIAERRSSGAHGGATPESPYHFHHAPGSPGSPQLLTSRRKLLPEQMYQLKDAIKNFLPPDVEKVHHHHHHVHMHMHTHAKDQFKSQVHRAYELLLQKTESSSSEEFIERFLEGQTLLNSLRKQQTLVDSRIMQLQSEHAELFATFSDLAFISDDAPASGLLNSEAAAATTTTITASTANAGQLSRPGTAESVQSQGEIAPGSTAMALLPGADDRYLDNRLFAHEVRMNQLLRSKDRAEQTVSDVRTAVASLIHLMAINSRLLYALPKSEPPKILTNDDIAAGISWFEDRITALSEALAMDANKPTGANTADDNKPLSERQMDLALLIQKMNLNNASKPGSKGGVRVSYSFTYFSLYLLFFSSFLNVCDFFLFCFFF